MSEQKNPMELIVCDRWRLEKHGTGFNVNELRGKEPIRPGQIVERRYYEEFNKASAHSGEILILDEEKTIEKSIEREELLKKRQEKDAMEKKTQAEVLSESLEKIIVSAGKKGGKNDK